jgi:hypothetical protein
MESVWIELCPRNKKHVLIGYFYRPPNENASWYNKFEEQIHIAKQTNLQMILLGDFNIDLLKCKANSKWPVLYKSFDLEQIVNVPTRVTENSRTLLDHVYTSGGIQIVEVSVELVCVSDHFPTAVTINNVCGKERSGHITIKYRKSICQNYGIIIENIRQELTGRQDLIGVNDELANFNEIVTRNYDQCAPLVTKRVRSQNKVPWITNSIRQAMRP